MNFEVGDVLRATRSGTCYVGQKPGDLVTVTQGRGYADCVIVRTPDGVATSMHVNRVKVREFIVVEDRASFFALSIVGAVLDAREGRFGSHSA